MHRTYIKLSVSGLAVASLLSFSALAEAQESSVLLVGTEIDWNAAAAYNALVEGNYDEPTDGPGHIEIDGNERDVEIDADQAAQLNAQHSEFLADGDYDTAPAGAPKPGPAPFSRVKVGGIKYTVIRGPSATDLGLGGGVGGVGDTVKGLGVDRLAWNSPKLRAKGFWGAIVGLGGAYLVGSIYRPVYYYIPDNVSVQFVQKSAQPFTSNFGNLYFRPAR